MVKYFKKFLLFFILITASFLLAHFGLAQELNTGNQFAEATGLPSADPRLIAARIVQIFLGFLGVIAVALIVYAGFLWMTSQGNQEKIEQAKSILKNTIIGLLIVLSAFGIVSFIMSRLLTSIQPGGGQSRQPGGIGGGVGALGNCVLDTVYPEPNAEEVPRNTSIIFTFKEEIDPSSVCNEDPNDDNEQCDGESVRSDGRIKIYKSNVDSQRSENWVTDVRVSQTSNNKTFVLIPNDYLGSSSEFIWYSVYLSNDITTISGDGVFNNCHTDYFQWQFEVSNKIDLTPPQVKGEGVFPPPDDARDVGTTTTSLQSAEGGITVLDIPNIYTQASASTPIPQGNSPTAEVEVEPNCSQEGVLTVAVLRDGVTAELSHQGTLLGSSKFNGNTITFEDVLTLTVTSGTYQAGNSWNIDVQSSTEADTLTVGSSVYTFVSSASHRGNIEVADTLSENASNIASVINTHSQIDAVASENQVEVTAETAGSQGNDIILEASDEENFNIQSMSGGQDKQQQVTVNGREDQPRNAVVQINFNEAIIPVTVSGSANEVSDYIRIINSSPDAGSAGDTCQSNADCLSFNCSDGTCGQGPAYLTGKFEISNQYKTVEFISDNQCGVNACGQPVYCLPSVSHLQVELEAANLSNCAGDDDCIDKKPYSNCDSVETDMDVCINTKGTATSSDDINHPLSSMDMDGIMDAALNSLDGNRDGEAIGPVSFYNENNPVAEQGDSYTWSFFITDEIRLEPPIIISTIPVNYHSHENLTAPAVIDFDSIMMSSSLRTGSSLQSLGDDMIEHKGINLWNFNDVAIGYWVTKENIDDEPPLDGYADRTKVFLDHTMFSESTTYRAQAGSGVKDIYQNCFKPSSGPACSGSNSVTEQQPSCCAGEQTASTSEEGNCL